MNRSSVLLVAAAAAVTFASAGFTASTFERHPASGVLQSDPHAVSRSGGSGLRGVGWSENFDSYTAGSQIIGQGGWEGWLGDPNAGALVDDDFSVSAPNSINISGPADIVRQFSGLTSGAYVMMAQQYIPAGFTGQSYFIIQNTYLGTTNWSTQVTFDSSTGQAANTGTSGGAVPYVTGEWVEIRVEIDLDADTQAFYYDDQLLYSGTWTGEVSGGGALNIASLNLYANGASPVYYDDISLAVVSGDDYAVALSATPAGQEGSAGDTVTYTVTVENTGALDDTYDITVDSIWDATPSVTTLQVNAGTSESFQVDVEIDGAAAPGDSDVATVTATSTAEPTVSDSIELTTTVGELPDAIFCSGFELDEDGSCAGEGGGGVPGTYTSRDGFLANVADGFYEEAFANVPANTALDSLSFAGSGFAYTITATGPGSNQLYNAPGLISHDVASDMLVVTFTGDPVTAVGGNFWASDFGFNPISAPMTLTLSDGTVETFTSSDATGFRGFVSEVPITSISIDASDTPANAWSTLDNLIVGTR